MVGQAIERGPRNRELLSRLWVSKTIATSIYQIKGSRDDLMLRRISIHCTCLTIGCCLLIAVIGCGKQAQGPKDRASVSGTVTFNGQPLPGGVMIFHSMERSDVTPISIYGGAYSTDRAPIGKNTVTVDTSSIPFGNPAAYVPIPAKYAEPQSSGLTTEIKSGDNEANFELKK